MCNMKDVPVCDINLSLLQSASPSTSNRSTACSLKRQIKDEDEQIKQLKKKISLQRSVEREPRISATDLSQEMQLSVSSVIRYLGRLGYKGKASETQATSRTSQHSQKIQVGQGDDQETTGLLASCDLLWWVLIHPILMVVYGCEDHLIKNFGWIDCSQQLNMVASL